MIRTIALLALSMTAACSRGEDKERWKAPLADPAPAATGPATTTGGQPPPATGRRIELKVTSKGFEPSPVKVKAGEPLTLVVTRTIEKTCATEIIVPGYGIEAKLPLNEAVTVNFTPKKSGEITYGCAMDQMVYGVLTVE